MANHPDNANLPVTNRPETILGVTIVSLALSYAAVALRLYVRLKNRIWGYDDLFVFLAVLSCSVGSIITCFMPDDGMGKHWWTLDLATKVQYFKHIWSTNVTYSSSTTFIKLSILFQYLRLFDFQSRIARKMTWCLIVFTALWGITFFLLAVFSCRPIRKNWQYMVPGTCVAWGSKDPDVFFASWAAHSASNMLLDILVLVLPIPFLRGLRIQGKTRLGLIGLFVVGGIVATMSVSRMIALSIKRAGTVPVLDMSYATPSIYIFSVLEINMAIICASIPIFWPLVTSLAANKILVVNEVEVRTDRRDSQNVGLAEQGARTGFSGLSEIELDDDINKGRTSRISVLMSGKETQITALPSMPRRSASKNHSSKPSTSSSKHAPSISIELGRTITQESQQNLAHQTSMGALSLASAHDRTTPLETTRNGSVGHYQDRYVQDWVVPDFDKGVGGGDTGNTTTVERAEIPFDHIRSRQG